MFPDPIQHAAPLYPHPSTPESACHRVLRCAEIVDRILETFFMWQPKERCYTIQSVALTCRGLADAASAPLWKELCSLKPLRSVLFLTTADHDNHLHDDQYWSIAVANANSVYSDHWQDPHLQWPTGWTRFLRCAAFVQTLRFWLSTDDEYEFLRLLGRWHRARPLFPSLQELEWAWKSRSLEPVDPSTISFFASPLVTILNKYNLITAETFPQLSSLTISFLIENTRNMSEIISYLRTYRQLRHLSIYSSQGPSPSDLFLLLSALPQLESLGVSVRDPEPGLQARPERFLCPPSLRSLVCQGLWPTIQTLPRLFHCPNLEKLELRMETPFDFLGYDPALDQLCDCVQALSDPLFAPRLRGLAIGTIVYQHTANGLDRSPLWCSALAPILQPLSALAHLEDLRFDLKFLTERGQRSPNYTDDDLRAIAVAFPRIQHLSIQRDLQYLQPPS
ncbi:hypothetical protein BC628DRAFT_1368718 [Trametes gibbosa]|nr:hypothetical protein BC628DRAFT_1368718 [Trametes gibbosa]